MVVEPVAAQEPRRQPVEPEHFDQSGVRREQRPPRSALIAPVGIDHAAAEHPVVAERRGFGQQGRDGAGGEATVRIQQQQVAAPRPASPDVAAASEPDVAVTADQDQPWLSRGPASEIRDDRGWIAVVDQDELAQAFLILGEHRLDGCGQHGPGPVRDHDDADPADPTDPA